MLTGMVAAMVAAQLKMASLQAQVSELDALRETVELQQMEIEETRADEWRECGGCGAHVHDWWYVSNMRGDALVEVCHDCYEACLDAERR